MATQMNEDPLNRRDAKGAETEQPRPLEDISLNGDWFRSFLPLLFALRFLRVSAVFFGTTPRSAWIRLSEQNHV